MKEDALATKTLQGNPALAAIKMQLQGYFAELFAVEWVPCDRSFLDLGGSSMDMLHLQFFIQQAFAVELKFGTLYQFSSVDLLSLVVLQAIGTESAPELFHLRHAPTAASVIAFIDTKGYDFLEYLEASKYIAADVEVVSIEWKNLDRDRAMRPQVLAFADPYANLLETFCQGLPIVLAASCDGTVVAYECARVLQRRSRSDVSVVIIDTRAHCPERLSAKYYVGRLRNFFASSGADRRKKIKKQLRLLWSKMRFSLSGKAGLSLGTKSVSWIGGMSMQPQCIDLSLIRGNQSKIQVPDDESLGWKSLTKGKFQLHRTDGDHYTIFEPPYVQALGNVLSEIAYSKTNS